MAKTKKPIQQVNICLIKSSVSLPTGALESRATLTSINATATTLPNGVLYYKPANPKPASWRSFVSSGFDASSLPPFLSETPSALLFFKAGPPKNQRLFAVTFGYARSWLKQSALEADFGLRTALNLCEPDTLRAVDFRTIEERSRISRVQLSEAGSVDAFQMNMDTSLLRGVEAESKDKKVCERLGARWQNLIVAARITLADLPKLAKQLLSTYKKKLPDGFKWIDNVRRESDPVKINTLEADLEQRVAAGTLDRISLAIPEVSGSPVNIAARLFKPANTASELPSDFADYLSSRPHKNVWTVPTAKMSHKVFLVDTATDKTIQKISVFSCIVAEIDHHGELYLLADGEWFQLDRNFVKHVNEKVQALDVVPHHFPAWKKAEPEGDWNDRACDPAQGGWADAAKLDKSNLAHGGGRSKIEPADLVTTGGVLGHAKRRDKRSGGLSHLFAQGVVASRLIARDDTFRAKVVAAIPTSHPAIAKKLKRPFDPKNWIVTYIILGADASNPGGSLPFFSKVNLLGAVEALQDMRYRVGVIGV